jgi:hypothetical protein
MCSNGSTLDGFVCRELRWSLTFGFAAGDGDVLRPGVGAVDDAVDQLQASEWTAMFKASVTGAVVVDVAVRQPTMQREQTSVTNAVCTNHGPGGDMGEVRHPPLVGAVRPEAALQQLVEVLRPEVVEAGGSDGGAEHGPLHVGQDRVGEILDANPLGHGGRVVVRRWRWRWWRVSR